MQIQAASASTSSSCTPNCCRFAAFIISVCAYFSLIARARLPPRLYIYIQMYIYHEQTRQTHC